MASYRNRRPVIRRFPKPGVAIAAASSKVEAALARSTRQIDREALDVLRRAEITGQVLRLPADLPRATYLKVDKVIQALGGRWNRSLGGHLFAEDPAPVLAAATGDGVYLDRRAGLGQFDTPIDLARRMAELAEIRLGRDRVLEPSAGIGRLVLAACTYQPRYISAIEIDEARIARLGAATATLQPSLVRIQHADFVAWADQWKAHGTDADKFDVVLMNPPLADGQDILHIGQAWAMLAAGGRLVAIAAEGAFHRADRSAADFRAWLGKIGAITEPLPAGTFREAGTDVATRLIIARRIV